MIKKIIVFNSSPSGDSFLWYHFPAGRITCSIIFGVYGCFFFSPCGLWGVYGGFAPMPPNVDKMWLNVDFVCIFVGFFVPLY